MRAHASQPATDFSTVAGALQEDVTDGTDTLWADIVTVTTLQPGVTVRIPRAPPKNDPKYHIFTTEWNDPI